ncbi:hypothetical protein BCR33DRAFT_845399 [Rhizoclosmatium globosum]|uniref:Uncharacterized protein n=1 Tax=Rhizoclosmatium globosum TaxID=329046 RepID=A0A1Y2D1R4_9FUNG|nr:hypothetical protein BCR33DRAFT_845399 [Rhizoclosmatium globosum]|eukprot:ORY53200.1 hypothetical protein BCR33DRAFT_845399 [Rhizoclosmatium globosum]
MMPMLQGRYTLDPLSLERGFSCSGCYGTSAEDIGQCHAARVKCVPAASRRPDIWRSAAFAVGPSLRSPLLPSNQKRRRPRSSPLLRLCIESEIQERSKGCARGIAIDVSIDVNVLNRRVPPSGSASVVSPSRGEEEHIVIATPTARRFKGFLKRRLPPSSTKYGATDNTDGHAADPEFGDAIRLLPI